MLVNVFAERERVLRALQTGEGLPALIRRMARAALMCALAYGIVLGAQIGGWQVLSSPVKLPLILLGTGAICVGALYVLLALAGARLSWPQVLGLALCSVCASGLAMLALLPITAFWTFSFGGDRLATTLTHSAAFFLAGGMGSRFGLEMASALLPERKMLRTMVVWMGIYGLVAQQMAWLFRPHFHATDVFMRSPVSGGSALESLVRMVVLWLRG